MKRALVFFSVAMVVSQVQASARGWNDYRKSKGRERRRTSYADLRVTRIRASVKKKELRMRHITLFWLFVVFTSSASAHHLDGYDARIRDEAQLPEEWFTCKTTKDCDLVSVPCQSELAINTKYTTEARDVLVHHFWFCLGNSLHESEAACEDRQCVTKNTKPQP